MCEINELEGEESAPECPICGVPADGDGSCRHVAISGDEYSFVDALREFADVAERFDVWAAREGERAPESSLAISLAASCAAAAGACRIVMDGGYVGMSGLYFYVWSADHAALAAQIREQVEVELKPRKKAREKSGKRPRRKAGREAEGDFQAKAAMAAAALLARLESDGGGVVSVAGIGEEGEASEDGPEVVELPVGEPTAEELEARRELHWLADRALTVSRDRHPLCVNALETLWLFTEGRKSRADLEAARAALVGRATAAGVVGLPHRCPNAAATLAVMGACSLFIEGARESTHRNFQWTIEFLRARQLERGERKATEGEALARSVEGTFFTELDGRYLGRVGQVWRETDDGIAILSAENPNYQQIGREENRARNLKLAAQLKQEGVAHRPILAWWPSGEGHEEAFAIEGLTVLRTWNFMTAFDQAAFFFALPGGPVTPLDNDDVHRMISRALF